MNIHECHLKRDHNQIAKIYSSYINGTFEEAQTSSRLLWWHSSHCQKPGRLGVLQFFRKSPGALEFSGNLPGSVKDRVERPRKRDGNWVVKKKLANGNEVPTFGPTLDGHGCFYQSHKIHVRYIHPPRNFQNGQISASGSVFGGFFFGLKCHTLGRFRYM